MSIVSSLTVSHTSVVLPEQIDELGHMNVRWYGHNAYNATVALRQQLGLGEVPIAATYTRHHHEQMEGNKLEVRSAVLGGGGRLRFYHELRNAADDDLAATFIHELDHPENETSDFALPDYGRPRTINIDTDGCAKAPSLDEARSRNLAIRFERDVTTEDSHGADVVPAWLANNLIWGGERPGGDSDWIRTMPNGDRVAFATMESRLCLARMPKIGTRIQSFGAVINVAEKISHSVNWAYDIDNGELLTSFEVIDLAINLTERRAIPIPDGMREMQLERFHPDLA